MTIKVSKNLSHPQIIRAEDNKYSLVIGYDEWVESPRQDENLGTLITWHRSYELTDSNCVAADKRTKRNTWSQEEFEEWWKDHEGIRLPVYMLDHSGWSVSTKPFGDPWDSGQLGWIYTPKDVLDGIIEHRVKNGDTKEEIIEEMSQYLSQEIEALDRFLRGDIYYYSASQKVRCECCKNVEFEPDSSCHGLYGIDDILSNVPHQYEHLAKAIKEEW